MVSRRSLLAAAPAAALAGCRSANPTLFTVSALPGEVRGNGPAVVAVREISLARYLDRLPIVRSAQDYRLNVSTNEWWGEPLEAMLTRVLVENLSQRLPRSSVFSDNGAITVPADATVEVNLQRLGTINPGTVTTTAQFAITHRNSRRPPMTRTENIHVPEASPEMQAFVAAVSTGVARLSDAIAAALVEDATRPASPPGAPPAPASGRRPPG